MSKLDVAVERYCSLRNLPSSCVLSTDELKKAFEGWVTHKMQQAGRGIWQPGMFLQESYKKIWKDDRRNSKGAMTKLFESLYTREEIERDVDARRAGITTAERDAINYMKECTEKSAAKLFSGKTMNFRLLAKKVSAVVSTAEDYMTPEEIRFKRLMDRLKSESVSQKAKKAAERAQKIRNANADRFAAAQELAGNLADAVDTFSGGASGELLEKASDATVGVVEEWLKSAIAEIIGLSESADVAETIFAAIGLESINQFAQTITPFLGSIKATAAGTKEIANGIQQAYQANSLRSATIVKGETAKAAVESIIQYLKDAAKENAIHGARHTLVGVGRLVADAFPGGQAASTGLSIADAIVDVLFMVKSYYEDYKHMKEVNVYLRTIQDPDQSSTPNTVMVTGKEMFEKSPLLGAYWIMIENTSSVIGICVDDLTASTFIQQVEDIAKNYLNDLRSAAAEMIASSNLVIPELSAHRLILEAKNPTPHSTWQRRLVDPIYDTFRSLTIYKRVEKKFPQPDWKNRIVGISSDQYFSQNP